MSRVDTAPDTSPPAVRVRGVTMDFGGGDTVTRALRGVDLDVASGELLMLVGPSGCGKTTLVSIVAGTLLPTSGELSVLGRDLVAMDPRQRVRFRRENVGFIFQSYNLLPALTAVENAAVPLIIAGWSRRRALPVAAELLERLGLGARMRSLPSELSGGQQQRVAIARALVHRPRLLICDEPTSALDADNGRITMELISTVAVGPGRAVIVVTHDQRVYGYADRIATMEDGRLVSIEDGDRRRSAPAEET